MAGSRQKEWLTDILESVPSIGFIALWRGGGVNLEVAGWAGSFLAAVVFVLLWRLKTRNHPVLFGVNLHILLVTPLIIGLYRLGADGLAGFLADHAYRGVLVTVFVVGTLLTITTARGFVGAGDLPARLRLSYSAAMLLVCLMGTCWAFAAETNGFIAVFVPLTVLFGLRRFLLARWQDHNGSSASAVLPVLPAIGSEHEEMV